MANVACGRFDGYWQRELNYWDIAAGIIIVKEAGGFVDFFDKDLDKHVSRTSQRPLASGAISSFEAFIIFSILNLIGLAILLSLNLLAIIIGSDTQWHIKI